MDFSWYYLKFRIGTHASPVRIPRSRWALRGRLRAYTNTGVAVFSIIVRCVDRFYHLDGLAMAGICKTVICTNQIPIFVGMITIPLFESLAPDSW